MAEERLRAVAGVRVPVEDGDAIEAQVERASCRDRHVVEDAVPHPGGRRRVVAGRPDERQRGAGARRGERLDRVEDDPCSATGCFDRADRQDRLVVERPPMGEREHVSHVRGIMSGGQIFGAGEPVDRFDVNVTRRAELLEHRGEPPR